MYRLLIGVARFLCKILLRLEVKDRENVPEKGPLLVVFNHTASLDTLLLTVLPLGTVSFGAYAHRFNVFLLVWKALGKLILVKRGKVDRKALRAASGVLESGGVLLISPEGTRTTGALIRAKSGAAYLALKSGGIPLLPIGIEGTKGSLGRMLRLKRPRVTIRIGKIFTLTVPTGLPRAVDLREVTDGQIMPQIVALLPREEMHGYYKRQPN
ncbi:1-acyl-sn-glycerol-3-phosphate acyltransferase [Candidatus Parcubacteria bacterium]|nr:1-acyl-sn-glycerol-3-phosphate acyltransferase [Candidatus Parcubacteria bacterium]